MMFSLFPRLGPVSGCVLQALKCSWEEIGDANAVGVPILLNASWRNMVGDGGRSADV